MLRERYARRNVFEEIKGIELSMEPVLMQLDKLLENDGLFRAVKGDLSQRYRKTLVTGRGSTPVEVVLRMLVVKHLYGWSYEQTEQWVSDSLILRQFCRVYLEKVPDDTTLIRWANLIQPETLAGLLEHVVRLAQQLKVTKGRKLRIDSTVVETNIHHPNDDQLRRLLFVRSSILCAVIFVINRMNWAHRALTCFFFVDVRHQSRQPRHHKECIAEFRLDAYVHQQCGHRAIHVNRQDSSMRGKRLFERAYHRDALARQPGLLRQRQQACRARIVRMDTVAETG